MPSGIYKLTFTDGSFYIGKSISISSRWKQHFDKFTKGKAASNMQQTFNMYGAPDGEILFKCHKDHIDIAEEMFINRLNPPLNRTYPPDPFVGMSIPEIEKISELFSLSTIEHIRRIKALEQTKAEALNIISKHNDEVAELELVISDLQEIRSQEVLDNDTNGYIEELKRDNDKLNSENQALRAKLSAPWWKRWFSK